MKAPQRPRKRTLTALKGLLLHGVKTATFDAKTGRLTSVEFFPYEFEGELPARRRPVAGTDQQGQGPTSEVTREAPKNAMDLVLGTDKLPDLSADPSEVPRTPKIERQ